MPLAAPPAQPLPGSLELLGRARSLHGEWEHLPPPEREALRELAGEVKEAALELRGRLDRRVAELELVGAAERLAAELALSSAA